MKDIRLPVMISRAELDAIDDWRFAQRVQTRAEAIRQLIALGLSVNNTPATAPPPAAAGLVTAPGHHSWTPLVAPWLGDRGTVTSSEVLEGAMKIPDAEATSAHHKAVALVLTGLGWHQSTDRRGPGKIALRTFTRP